MRNKLKYLVGVSLGRKVKTKWFLVSQIVLGILIIGIINMDSIINAFGGDFNDKTNIYILDETNKSYDLFKESLELSAKSLYGEDSSNYEITEIDELEETKTLIDEEGGIIIQILSSDTNTIELNIISKKSIDTYDYALISSAANSVKMIITLDDLGLTNNDYIKIMSDVVINKSLINDGEMTNEESTDMIMSTVFPILILPIFMLSIFLVQMVGAEVNDEKTTKAMEIIIANVSPKVHFFAKVIAGNVFVLIQGFLLIVFAGIGMFIRQLIGSTGGSAEISGAISSVIDMIMNSSIGEKLIYLIPLLFVLIILTFIAYSLLAGILASMTTTTEDYQQVQTPIMIISLLGYYLAMMAGMFEGSIIIKILSFVPFISTILCPSLLILGQIGFMEVIGAIAVMALTIYLLIKYGLKIYKVGILNYSSSGLWKKMAKALKD